MSDVDAKHIKSRELRRQAMQAALDSRNSVVERNRLGQFATPPGLAMDIATCVASMLPPGNRKDLRFGEPAVGSGSFFSAALAVWGSRRLKSAVGIEIDPAFAQAARELWSAANLDIVEDDFTRVMTRGSRPPAPNLILANPPYVRHHHLSRGDKARLQDLVLKLTGVRLSGLAGLYVYFLLLATAWLEDDGIAAWLLPSEFMDVNYGAALKRFLIDQVTLLRVHRFHPDDVQFGDALVSSAVLIVRKTPPKPDHAVTFTHGGSLMQPQACEQITLDHLRHARKWTVHPAHPRNDRHTGGALKGATLGDLFRIQRGIATGCNKFFILDLAQARRLHLPARYLRPILPSPRHLKTNVIDMGSDGYPLIEQPLCVIDCDLPEPLVQAAYPALWDYLQTADALGLKNGYLIGKRSPWYKQEQREAAPFLCTYMGRGTDDKAPFRFIWNRSQAIGSNLYLMLHPRPPLAAMLGQHPERAGMVHQLLNQVTAHELRGEGRVYGGGLNKIEPRELARVSARALLERWPELQQHQPEQEHLFV